MSTGLGSHNAVSWCDAISVLLLCAGFVTFVGAAAYGIVLVLAVGLAPCLARFMLGLGTGG